MLGWANGGLRLSARKIINIFFKFPLSGTRKVSQLKSSIIGVKLILQCKSPPETDCLPIHLGRDVNIILEKPAKIMLIIIA